MTKGQTPLQTESKLLQNTTENVSILDSKFKNYTNATEIKHNTMVSKHCPKCDKNIEAINMDTLSAHMNEHISECNSKIENKMEITDEKSCEKCGYASEGHYELIQHKRDYHRGLSANSY